MAESIFHAPRPIVQTLCRGSFTKNKNYWDAGKPYLDEPDEAKRKQMLSELNDFFLEEGIVYPVATSVERLMATTKVKDIGHRRIPLFKFTETWLET